jgi:hypothetical protein
VPPTLLRPVALVAAISVLGGCPLQVCAVDTQAVIVKSVTGVRPMRDCGRRYAQDMQKQLRRLQRVDLRPFAYRYHGLPQTRKQILMSGQYSRPEGIVEVVELAKPATFRYPLDWHSRVGRSSLVYRVILAAQAGFSKSIDMFLGVRLPGVDMDGSGVSYQYVGLPGDFLQLSSSRCHA